MEIKIERATVDDAEMIALIGKISFRKAFEHSFCKRTELYDYLKQIYNTEKIARSICKENNIYLIASIDDRAVGFAKMKKHSLNDQIEANFQMELQKLYVFPGYQGQSVGKALMDEVKKLAIEFYPDYIWASVYTCSHRAINFYERNCFKVAGREHFTIGTQTFNYKIMAWPVALRRTVAC